ncbi:hypothetical protein LOZ57_001142 [Ophidiomyces ophidiicola]|uniref:uncharacterized protein n=1 Tax=Ophidiomyces ophidiicola TaxID=1387563 RepID=UPI0020C401FB|nr:uncharacterized protein LOZ57_001142 [Ophidiomyces ophidiicola]KAI1951730.1 hypothetical protein LOZ57_001142 [Ophidiomyces ophidiicola]KAI2052718.1 hypothetical protein LOZ43_004480 [Ophidiomyces ophidiicola]
MANNSPHTSLFTYTAGRWLRLDKAQRDARYVEFDFVALCEKVLSLCPSATSIKSFYKIEGGFSKVLILETDDGKRVVVKFPTSVVGPARHVTNSEVATITYLQRNTKIPIPAILDWSDDPANPIGAAYIILEHVGGVLLQEAWTDMPSHLKVKCTGAICSSVLPVSELDFPAYGSLYFSNASFLDDRSKKLLESDTKYCIGPHCRGSTYWDCNVGEPRHYTFSAPNRGPWCDLSSYAAALIDSGLARLPQADLPFLHQQNPPYQGTVDRHLKLLKLGRAVLPELVQHPDIKSNAAPMLFHPDLHKRNIFISEDDPTKITGIIDWQCASVEPAFYYADDSPDFAKVPAEGTPESADESLCSQAYEIGCALLAPRLGGARKIDETLLRPFRYCHRTWRDGFVPFTHELLQLRDSWQKLGFEKNCPIPALGPDEMSFYKEQLYTYNSMLELRQDMVETLGVEEDGWTSEARWEGVRQTYQYFYENIMANLEDDKQRKEAISMWPFDQPATLQQPKQI